MPPMQTYAATASSSIATQPACLRSPQSALQPPVRPRRILRASARPGSTAPDPHQTQHSFNLFADVFGTAPRSGPEPNPQTGAIAVTDPRVAASRSRARRLILPQVLPSADTANFWHPDGETAEADPSPRHGDATITASGAAPVATPVAAPVAANAGATPTLAAQISHDRLRDALYPQANGTAKAHPPQTPHLRLAAHAMNATLLLIAFPVGAAVLAHSALRGSNIRVSAQAMAAVTAVTAFWQGGIERFL